MASYWLLKTEPDCWSWDQQTANKGLSVWDGVRNHQAQKAMKNMVVGDLCFFYHTGKLKEVCGIVQVVKTFYPDPTDATEKWGAVDVQEVLPLKSNVTLSQMKEDDEISDFLMFRQPRLSVVPVEEKNWVRICRMGEIEPPRLGLVSKDFVASEQVTSKPKAAKQDNESKKDGIPRKRKSLDARSRKLPPTAAEDKPSEHKTKPKRYAKHSTEGTDEDGEDSNAALVVKETKKVGKHSIAQPTETAKPALHYKRRVAK